MGKGVNETLILHSIDICPGLSHVLLQIEPVPICTAIKTS